MSRLKRALFDQQSAADDILGGVIAGIAIVLIFRFGFGDPWGFAIVSGVIVGIVSAAVSALLRRRKRSREAV